MRGRTILLGLLILVLIATALQRLALRDLRRVEADYIASRKPTACAIEGLVPFAENNRDFSEIDDAIATLVDEASTKAAAVRTRFESRKRVVPYPPVREASAAVGRTLVAQTGLYEAMTRDPLQTDDELRTFARRYADAERKIGDARKALFVGPGDGWSRRAICDDRSG
jgi:hypothetical protein